MSLFGRRSSECQKPNSIDKPSATLSSERDTFSANFSTISTSSQKRLCNSVFEETSRDGRSHRKRRDGLPSERNRQNVSGSETSFSDLRLSGGESKVWTCKYQPPSDFITKCKRKKQSVKIQKPAATNVAVINVELKDYKRAETRYDRSQCQFLGGWGKRMLTKSRGTQTLYRESSAQTLPFLPAVSNNTEELDNLELFRLPTILPGDGPPGLYEVEVLERARKRWAFTKALKAGFKRQIEDCKENISSAAKSHIIEAFEWEMWMEREEHIQECQMLRLELVIRMFENREKKMHDASRSRIAKSMEIIQTQRQAGLRKNEIEYGRQLRRLEMQKLNMPRMWRKENITYMFDDPKSEFYAPQMRYGVNPDRRHFIAERKAFDASIDALNTKAINMNKLMCPFAKLKEWSRPKLRLKEVEQNFCTDINLKKLYDSLKKLRLECGRQKMMPKCLKEKAPISTVEPEDDQDNVTDEVSDVVEPIPLKDDKENQKFIAQEEETEKATALMILQESKERKRSLQLNIERRDEELEAMLEEYEGSTVGWLMKFLSDEMHRLEEQRNLHFFTMLAQKERWRREAAEAGLRQKENDMRIIYEELFQKSNEANVQVCTEYLRNIMDVDTKEYAEQKASASIVRLAKVIDVDIQRWIDSVKSVQNPLNYQMLRYLLKDIIFPNADILIKRYETELIIDSIIYEDIFPHIEKLLEPYDISFTISSDLVDHLIDNDIYYFSDDSSGSSITAATQQEHEARAILRKLIRRAVPGRRWMTSNERLADGNISELLDEVFESIKTKEEELKKQQEASIQNENLVSQGSYLNLIQKKPKLFTFNTDTNSDELMCFLKSSTYDEKEKNILKQVESGGKVSMHKSDISEDKLKNYTEAIAENEQVESPTTYELHLEKSPTISQTDLEAKDTKIFLQETIVDIIKKFIPEEAPMNPIPKEDVDQSTEQNERQESESLLEVVNSEDKTNETISKVQSSNSARLEVKEENVEEDLLQLSVNESELELMEVVRCKCKKEIERENLIRKLLKQGRVKVIRKPKPDKELSYSENSVETVDTFGYESDSTSSQHRSVTQDEEEEQTDYLNDQFDVTTTADFPIPEEIITEAEEEVTVYSVEQREEAPSEMQEFTENGGTAETGNTDEQSQPVIEAIDVGKEDNFELPLDDIVEETPIEAPLTAEDAFQSTSAQFNETVEPSEQKDTNQDNLEDLNKKYDQDVTAKSSIVDMPTNEIENEVAPELDPNTNAEATETNAESTTNDHPNAEDSQTTAENTINDQPNAEGTETNAENTTNEAQ